jgi:hypothetical protein
MSNIFLKMLLKSSFSFYYYPGANVDVNVDADDPYFYYSTLFKNYRQHNAPIK